MICCALSRLGLAVIGLRAACCIGPKQHFGRGGRVLNVTDLKLESCRDPMNPVL